jgi:iron complex transport system substrate-binding protein
MSYPQRIVCLTEESVETLFALGQGHRIVGVSNYVERPVEATRLPKVSMFINSKFEKIDALKPDLVLGFSDIQSDIAKELIQRGHNVFIANHRRLEEILSYIQQLSGMIGVQQAGEKYVQSLKTLIEKFSTKRHTQNKRAPLVYFEEWDDPMISAIGWVSDLITQVGGEDIFREYAGGSLAKERFVTSEQVIERNPDIIFGCWCGKKVKIDKIKNRPGWENINAIKNNQIFELDPAIFLQPGPAPIVDGMKILNQLLDNCIY